MTYEIDVLAQLLDSIIGEIRTSIGEQGVFNKASTDRPGYCILSFEADQGLYSIGHKPGVVRMAVRSVDVLHDNMPDR